MSRKRETPTEPAIRAADTAAAVRADGTAVPELSGTWKILSLVLAFVAAKLAQNGLQAFWRSATGKQPPRNLGDPNVEVREAMVWAALSAMIVALARLVATRRATRYYVRSTTGRHARTTQA